MKQRYCICGCGEKIEPNLKSHKQHGIPKYCPGHWNRGRKKTEVHKAKLREVFRDRKYDPVECLECGVVFIPKSSREKWCKKCSKERRHNYLRQYEQEHYWSDIEETRKKSAMKQRRRNKELRDKVLEKFGGKCIRCEYADSRALQIDHVDGDGKQDRKKFRTSSQYYLHLLELKDISKYQLLCANCNWVKKVENDETARRYKEERK